MINRTRFTEEEINIICEYKDQMTVPDLAVMLNRDYKSVLRYLRRNSLSFKKLEKNIFTDREDQILKLLAAAYSIKDISKTLYITETTVKQHLTNICNKIPLRKNTQLNIALWYLKYIKNLDIDFKED